MLCANCKTENPDGLKFCNECGAAFKAPCASCGFENAPAAKFFGQCGASLITILAPSELRRTEPSPATSGDTSNLEGERRHISVLFCDLVNSTEIVARLDPEEWGQIAADYHSAAAEAVVHLGGHVAEYLGDGVVVYFGYPEAHEDDVERAVRGGLAIVDAIGSLNARLAASQVKLSVRVGIHTGTVVISHGGGGGTRVFGDTTFIASRVQNAAEPNTVVITKHTHQLVGGRFIAEGLGKHHLKGVEEPVELFRIVRSSGTRSRLTIGAARGLTPFVGREDEMRLLASRWERAREGHGQVVLVVGEPGIGKSRLVEEFRARIKDDPHL